MVWKSSVILIYLGTSMKQKYSIQIKIMYNLKEIHVERLVTEYSAIYVSQLL